MTKMEGFNGLIFNHDFLKAFFGEELEWNAMDECRIAWEGHAQQLVLEEDPLQYLYDHLDPQPEG